MRILLTSIGRRGYLARYFREALGTFGQVWGGDCSRLASAFHNCHHSLILPCVTDKNYIEEIFGLCRRHNIDMLIPLIDPELEVLSAVRQRFFDAGIMLVVSPIKSVEISFDKYFTFQFGRQNEIPVPETVLTLEDANRYLADGRFQWPLVVKARRGSASAHIHVCASLKELKTSFKTTPLPMIQEYLDGAEFGYDIFGDHQFRPVSVFCKKKLAMRAGETDKAVSVNTPELTKFGLKIANAIQIFGPADADVIFSGKHPKLLEINPRFGGGYPCSHLSGADFPAKLVRLCRGKSLEPDIGSYQEGVYMLKQDEIICRSAGMIDSIKSLVE